MMNNNHDDVVTGIRGGGPSPEQSRGLKKGPWTAAEDAILTEYVKKHGEGNWNAVQKNSGLARCGKSCRLRWANHLRPNLKKGSFSPEEERIIIELHAKLGNKWARMASQLPGRTDNEIKNYWNTRMKRRQRAGLPLYPQDIQQEAVAFHLQQQQQQEQHHQIRSSNSSPSSFTSLLSPSHSHQKSNHANSFSFYEPINLPLAVSNSSFHYQSPSGFYPQSTDQFKLFSDQNGNGGVSYPFSQISPFGSSTVFNQSAPVHTHLTNPNSTLQYNFGSNYGVFGQSNFSFSSMLAGGSPYEHSNIDVGTLMVPTSNLVTELPSTQTPPQSTTTPANSSSNTSCGDHHHRAKDYPKLDPKDESQRNSGLLDAVIVEAHALSSRKDKVRSETSLSGPSEKRRRILEEDGVQVESALKIHHHIGDQSRADHDHLNQNDDDLTSVRQTPNGVKEKTEEAVLEDMNNMDDDLMSLLHNFPATTTPALPEWCPRREDLSNERSLGLRSGNNNNIPQISSTPLPTPPTILDRTFDDAVCCWKNMPGIC